jgi:hypothetical protein
MIRTERALLKVLRMSLAALAVALPLAAGRAAHAQGAIGVATSITVQQFMEDLSNYGTWTSDPHWGWVWQPRGVLPGWRPYAQGQWLVAEGFGMYWQSYEPFGWAVYHYGRWAWWGNNRGWVWIPDKTWGPGYVNWAYGEGYVAWTPMPPSGPGPQAIQNGHVKSEPWMWTIVPQPSLLTSNVWQWAVPSARNANLMPHLEQHTVFSGVSDYSLPKDMVLAISGSGDPAQPVTFSMTPLGVTRGDTRGTILAYAPVLTGAAQAAGRATSSRSRRRRRPTRRRRRARRSRRCRRPGVRSRPRRAARSSRRRRGSSSSSRSTETARRSGSRCCRATTRTRRPSAAGAWTTRPTGTRRTTRSSRRSTSASRR